MAITVTVTESPTYITVDEPNLTVTLNQSDNPITVSTTSDLTLVASLAEDVTYSATTTLPGGNVQEALADLAEQFFKQSATPSGSNLEEGVYVYDIEITSGAGTVTRLMEGNVTVNPEVTR